jgi:hypothetical protein
VPTGHIYVRQKFRDIFDAPIALGGRDDLLGNHIFTILGAEPGGQAQWQVVTTSSADDEATAEEALDRVGMTAPIREFIALRLTPGSSLIVSDAGLGKETGRGTDFIVQPPVRKQPRNKIADRR